MINDDVIIQFLIVLGSIITTYLTVKYKDKIIKKNKDAAPKDRMDTIFDGYESLIKQQQQDIDRKQRQLDATQGIIDRLQDELNQTREIVRQQQAELVESRESNKELIRQLDLMKNNYTHPDAQKSS